MDPLNVWSKFGTHGVKKNGMVDGLMAHQNGTWCKTVRNEESNMKIIMMVVFG